MPPSSKPEENASPLIDPQALQEFLEIAGPDLLQDILKTYLQDAPQRLQAIEAAVTQGDAQLIASTAHALKSSSKSVGAMRMGQLCERLEHLGRNGQTQETGELLRQLHQESQTTFLLLQQHWFPSSGQV